MLNVLVVDDVRISKVCFDGEDNLNNLNPENVNAVVEVTQQSVMVLVTHIHTVPGLLMMLMRICQQGAKAFK